MHKKGRETRKLKKIFELKNERYRDGTKRKETRYRGMALHINFGIAHCGMLHTIQVDDVITILSP